MGLSRRDLARCCQGYRAASPAARGTRGDAGAAGCPELLRVMPGAIPSGPQVLPELRARCASRGGAFPGEACSEHRPAATPLTHSRPEPRRRQDFLCAAFEAFTCLAALDLHNQILIPVVMHWVYPHFLWHLHFKSCDVWRWEGSLVVIPYCFKTIFNRRHFQKA